MEITVAFPGGSRVDAHFGSFTVKTDQPQPGGDGSAPTPFQLFMASLATCAGVYVQSFCRMRNIPSEGIRLIQTVERDSKSGMADKINLDIRLPKEFPEQYRSAVIKAAEQCLVKKHLENPPTFNITASTAG